MPYSLRMSEEITTKEIPGTLEAVSILILTPDNQKVLLVKHTKEAQNSEGVYGLPGGRIELGESPREAAIRELNEETGLTATEESLEQYEGNFFGDYIIRTKGDIQRHAHMKVYHCNLFEGELNEDPKTIPEWVDKETIDEWVKEDKEQEKREKEFEKKIEWTREEEEAWGKRRLMPNIANAINNYLESIKLNK